MARSPRPLARSAHAVAVLARFPVRWGHVLVVLSEHHESLEATPLDAWLDAASLAHAAARALERVLAPSRSYIASLGTSEPDLPMTFPHVHLHVIPVEERGARPADVFTWKDGVLEASAAEWTALEEALLAAWP
ncbi:MAG: HIT domain-containing protein [Sandaracinaceae bacterium]|nr:HIT domain-containing protein [Sandaracinaceae bacterium]